MKETDRRMPGRFFTPSLKTYIFNLKIGISSLEIYIFRLEIQFVAQSVRFLWAG